MQYLSSFFRVKKKETSALDKRTQEWETKKKKKKQFWSLVRETFQQVKAKKLQYVKTRDKAFKENYGILDTL